jgi:hypothetical protein
LPRPAPTRSRRRRRVDAWGTRNLISTQVRGRRLRSPDATAKTTVDGAAACLDTLQNGAARRPSDAGRRALDAALAGPTTFAPTRVARPSLVGSPAVSAGRPSGPFVAATPSTRRRLYDRVCSMAWAFGASEHRRPGSTSCTPSTRRRPGDCVCSMAWRLPVWRRYLVPQDLQFVSCFDELKRSTCPRSRPGHGPEVGPPVRLIYGDVSHSPV